MKRCWGGWGVLVTLCLGLGCSRQTTAPPEATAGQQLSFGRGASPTGPSPTAGLLAHRLPAGTEIVFHLRDSLSSANARVGDPFHVVLEKPLVVGGWTLSAGSELTGRVVEASSADSQKAAGCLRLTLVGLILAGKQVPMKTSSVFLKAARPDGGLAPADIVISPRRALALRLLEPVDISD